MLIAYENEAITAQQKGEELDYVIPDETILIENPIAVVSSRRARDGPGLRRLPPHRRGAEGLRREGLPVDPARRLVDDVARIPTPKRLFEIAEFGGWEKVMDDWFDREGGIMADIQREVGAPLE